MKTLTTKLRESSPPDLPSDRNGDGTGHIVRHEAGRVLSAEERAAQTKRLGALAAMDDEHIDTSEIPPVTEEQFKEMIHGPWTPRESHTVTLQLDAEVVAWLEGEGKKQGYLINLLLKREAQRDKRRKAVQGAEEMGKAS